MVDESLIGLEFPLQSTVVEHAKIEAYARAIGDTNPIYYDDAQAIAQGYRARPIPPTYLVPLKHAVSDPQHVFHELGIVAAAGKLLHAEQKFTYHEPICAGDHLTFRERLTDIYRKKGGALTFVVLETAVTNQDGREVALITHTEVIREDM